LRIQRSLPEGAGTVDRNGDAFVLVAGGFAPVFRPALRTKRAAANSNSTIATAMIAYSGFHRLMVAMAKARSYPRPSAGTTRGSGPAPADTGCEMVSYFG